MAESTARYIKWEPVEGIGNQTCVDLRVFEDDSGLALVLQLCELRKGDPSPLKLTFGHVVAYASYEEFAHPSLDHAMQGVNIPLNNGFPYPCLAVHNSPWVKAFSPARAMAFASKPCQHYSFYSLDRTVDVLTTQPVHAEWV